MAILPAKEMPMSETKRKDITCVDFAKQIAPFLKTTKINRISLLGRAVLTFGAIIKSLYGSMAGSKKDDVETMEKEEEDEKRLSDMGISTQEEKNAYAVAHAIEAALFFAIIHAKHSSFVGEITKADRKLCWLEEQEFPLEIKMKEEMFKKILSDAVQLGIIELKEDRAVNPDFHGKATEKLYQEIHARVKDGAKVNVFGYVAVSRDGEGMYYMKRHRIIEELSI